MNGLPSIQLLYAFALPHADSQAASGEYAILCLHIIMVTGCSDKSDDLTSQASVQVNSLLRISNTLGNRLIRNAYENDHSRASVKCCTAIAKKFGGLELGRGD